MQMGIGATRESLGPAGSEHLHFSAQVVPGLLFCYTVSLEDTDFIWE